MAIDAFIGGLAERDIDLLLSEELYASAGFANWIAKRLELGMDEWKVASVHRSVVDSFGETDVTALFVSSLTTASALILFENKIAARFQPLQPERYLKRAENSLCKGKCSYVKTVLLAPAVYMTAEAQAAFHAVLTYEDLISWFLETEVDARTSFKVLLLQRAIEKAKTGYQPREDQHASGFWHSYWELCQLIAPELLMPEPTGRPAGSDWIYFKPVGLPANVQLVHKLTRGAVDLQFAGAMTGQAIRAYTHDQRYELVRTGKSVAWRVKTAPIDMQGSFDAQVDSIRVAILSAQQLASAYMSGSILNSK
jgi:hypothetical protein